MGAVCAAAMLAAGSASAATFDSQTMTVSAKVLGVCKFTSPTSTMAFADISPDSTGNATTTTTISYKCTKGTAASAMSIDGVGNTSAATFSLAGSGGNPDTVPVTLGWTTPNSQANGFAIGAAAIDVVVTGTITATNFANKQADTYTKVVTVAITP